MAEVRWNVPTRRASSDLRVRVGRRARIAVTNASVFADPWMRWCDDDRDQAAGGEAMRRAIDYVARRGCGERGRARNDNADMSHPVPDTISPDNGEPIERLTGGNCAILPGEVPGVVTVSAVGAPSRTAQYSNYGTRDVE
jgi:hypothetical protein